MMKQLFTLVALSSILLLSACGNDDSPKDLTINLKLQNSGAPVVAFESFDYPGGYDMFLTKFSLFLSDIELVRADNTSVLVRDVVWADLLDGVQSVQAAQAGINLVVPNFPSDKFTRLRANIGVPSDLNATQPSDYDNTSALSNNGEYWVGWSSYIFHKTEGKIDTDGDGDFETNVALHIGSDDAFRTSEFDLEINLDDEQNIDIIIDINDIFNIDGSYYDFEATPQIHHLGLLPTALPIMDALSKEITIK